MLASAAARPGRMPARWIHGAPGEPRLQVHAWDRDLAILRQSKAADFEGPFLYLVFGAERALLIDSGAGGDPPLLETYRALVDWRRAQGLPEPQELVVAHTHPDRDHVAGDATLASQRGVRVVGHALEEVRRVFALDDWPAGTGRIDLGGRALDVVPVPGHHPAHVAFFDAAARAAFTGDAFYPGYLFVSRPEHWPDFVASARRLERAASARGTRWLLGSHVEMSRTPGCAYRYGTNFQPRERALELEPRHLRALVAALADMGERAVVRACDDFVIWPAWTQAPQST